MNQVPFRSLYWETWPERIDSLSFLILILRGLRGLCFQDGTLGSALSCSLHLRDEWHQQPSLQSFVKYMPTDGNSNFIQSVSGCEKKIMVIPKPQGRRQSQFGSSHLAYKPWASISYVQDWHILGMKLGCNKKDWVQEKVRCWLFIA